MYMHATTPLEPDDPIMHKRQAGVPWIGMPHYTYRYIGGDVV